MNWKAFALGAAGSVALHVWLIWPARPAIESSSAIPEPETTRVAVREVDAERLRERDARQARASDRGEAQPQPPAAEPASLAAAEPASQAATQPAPASGPASQPAAPARAVEPAPQPAAAAAVATAREAIIESVPTVEDRPSSEEVAARIEQYEQRAARLSEAAPRPAAALAPAPAMPPPAVRSVPDSSPAAPAVPAVARAQQREIPPVQIAPRLQLPAPRSPAFPWLKRQAPSVELSGVQPPAPSEHGPRVAAAAAAAPAAAVAPIRPAAEVPPAVRREPAQYRPVSFGGSRGTGRDRPMSAAFGQAVDRGAMAALTQAPRDPVARIAWGDASEALRMVDLGRMALVTVDEELKIVGALEPSGAGWKRSAAVPDLGAFSSRVRVVDHVAAFAHQAALCSSGEHLAVVVPLGLERRIDNAMDAAARREGLVRMQVAACYGRLVAGATGIEFVIDRVERRNGT